MEDLQLSLTPSRVDQRGQGIMMSNWRGGANHKALVSDRTSGGVILTVEGHRFVTPRDLPVLVGDRI